MTCADVSQLIRWWIELNQTLCIPFQAQLAAAIPKVGAASSSSASSPAVKELRKLMEQVDTIKAERDAIEQDLKVQQDDMGELGDTRVIQGRYHNWINSGLSVKSNTESYCFSFAVACEWSENSTLSVNQKTKTNHDSVTRVFPRFRQFVNFFSSSHWFLVMSSLF